MILAESLLTLAHVAVRFVERHQHLLRTLGSAACLLS
jgi:hypothetical protein